MTAEEIAELVNLLEENNVLRTALTKIAVVRFEHRETVNEKDAWPAFQRLNRKFGAVCDLAADALRVTSATSRSTEKS